MRKSMMLVALTTVGAILFAASAFASGGWTRLGGDPVTPGGLAVYSGDGNAKHGYVKLITSHKGATAMRYAGLNKSERTKFVLATRMGKFHSCLLKYGDHFVAMSFGINGTSVDRDVTFLDPRYRYHGAAAFCAHVIISKKVTVHKGEEKLVKTVTNSDGSTDYYYDRVDTVWTKTCYVDSLVPEKCGNFAIVRRFCVTTVRHVHHRRTNHVPPPPMSAVMNSIQEVYNDGEIYPNLSGMLNSPDGDTISCELSVTNETKDGPGAGSIQDPTSYTFTSTGNNQVVGTWVYVAPDDNGGNASVGWNYLKLVCKDLSNSKVKPATAYSLKFEVQQAPGRP